MCTRPASTASANSTMWRVPSTLATRWRLGVRRSCRRSRRGGRGGRRCPRAARGPRRRRPSRGSERSPTIADDAIVVDAPAVAQLLEPALRTLADEHVDRPLALEQELDQVAADEPGCAGDEVAHYVSSSVAAAAALTLLLRDVAFELAPDPGDRGEPDVKHGRTRRLRRRRGPPPGHRRAAGAGARRLRLPGVRAADLAGARGSPRGRSALRVLRPRRRPRSTSCARTSSTRRRTRSCLVARAPFARSHADRYCRRIVWFAARPPCARPPGAAGGARRARPGRPASSASTTACCTAATPSGPRTQFLLECLADLDARAARAGLGARRSATARPSASWSSWRARSAPRPIHVTQDVSPFARRRGERARAGRCADAGIELRSPSRA